MDAKNNNNKRESTFCGPEKKYYQQSSGALECGLVKGLERRKACKSDNRSRHDRNRKS